MTALDEEQVHRDRIKDMGERVAATMRNLSDNDPAQRRWQEFVDELEQQPRQLEIDREQEWWKRIEEAIERGGGFEEARDKGWLTQTYGPVVEQMRESRAEVLVTLDKTTHLLRVRSLRNTGGAALQKTQQHCADLF